MSDQSFHEIQLSGKQLFFTFMTAVVVAVVIFLLGVSVGRGVRSGPPAAAEVGAPGDTTVAATPAPGAQPPPLTYHDQLQGQTPPPAGGAAGTAETTQPAPAGAPGAEPPSTVPAGAPVQTPPAAADVKPAPPVEKPAAPTAPPVKPPEKPATKPAEKTPAPKPAPSAGAGITVQVGAFSTKERADAVVATLKGKGFAAFSATQGRLFPVRVGPFADRAEAERAQNRLIKEGFPSAVIR
jgi:cell division septation protein DedD